MMKYQIITSILLSFIFFSCIKESRLDKKAIEKTMAYQQEAWNKGNIKGFMDAYWKSDSLKFVGKNGITYGWESTYKNYLESYPDQATMGELTFTILEINTDQELATTLGKWNIDRESGAIGGYFTLIWKNMDGRWVIICDHTS